MISFNLGSNNSCFDCISPVINDFIWGLSEDPWGATRDPSVVFLCVQYN